MGCRAASRRQQEPFKYVGCTDAEKVALVVWRGVPRMAKTYAGGSLIQRYIAGELAVCARRRTAWWVSSTPERAYTGSRVSWRRQSTAVDVGASRSKSPTSPHARSGSAACTRTTATLRAGGRTRGFLLADSHRSASGRRGWSAGARDWPETSVSERDSARQAVRALVFDLHCCTAAVSSSSAAALLRQHATQDLLLHTSAVGVSS
ncbi:hypothetical protein EJ04DRAFT_230704 [Polyplosphaeria fusca]|uniref:Uncharacterized protein n=1 Tax=Polyplosphaeria fusca TaxID=682080 RepID=A0A9P4V2U4_9PLEO|nr:hypothetical protein EJ04DRAFT_230704 [Polyplosphaeria fusca]